MRTKILILGLVCLIFMYCATAPIPRDIVKSFPVEASFDKTWTAMIEAFADLQLPIQNMEKDSGLIITDWIDFTGQTNEDYCDCGSLGMLLIEVGRSGKFNIFIKKVDENSCEVKINCMFEQTVKIMGENATSQKKCISTGNLESEIFKLIQEKI